MVSPQLSDTEGRNRRDYARSGVGKKGLDDFSPHFEEKVNLIALREENRRLFHAYFQVKTATPNKRGRFEFTLKENKFIEGRDFYYVWVCMKDPEFRHIVFYVVPSLELRIGSRTWKNTGQYTFSFMIGGKWETYRDKFDLLNPV